MPPLSCDCATPSREKTAGSSDRVLRHKGNFRWQGVKPGRYKKKEGGWSAITRHVLVGDRGETVKFHVRYFEIVPEGFSSHERHRHEHVVICIRGKGKVTIGTKSRTLKYLDTAYIAPNTVHQLSNPYDEPFGFLCIVNAKRDRPKPVPINKR